MKKLLAFFAVLLPFVAFTPSAQAYDWVGYDQVNYLNIKELTSPQQNTVINQEGGGDYNLPTNISVTNEQLSGTTINLKLRVRGHNGSFTDSHVMPDGWKVKAVNHTSYADLTSQGTAVGQEQAETDSVYVTDPEDSTYRDSNLNLSITCKAAGTGKTIEFIDPSTNHPIGQTEIRCVQGQPTLASINEKTPSYQESNGTMHYATLTGVPNQGNTVTLQGSNTKDPKYAVLVFDVQLQIKGTPNPNGYDIHTQQMYGTSHVSGQTQFHVDSNGYGKTYLYFPNYERSWVNFYNSDGVHVGSVIVLPGS